MAIYEKYCSSFDEFSSYEEFKNNFKMYPTEDFNFAYDCMDVLAKEKPEKVAMRWTNVEGAKRDFTFADLKYYSDKTANFLSSVGIKKGDAVMLILKRHYEYWWTILALHKLGAIVIPASNLLTPKDIVYRCDQPELQGQERRSAAGGLSERDRVETDG